MPNDTKFKVERLDGTHMDEDEPVFAFGAQDKFLPEVLMHYADMCHMGGASQEFVEAVLDQRRRVQDWQDNHTAKVPD